MESTGNFSIQYEKFPMPETTFPRNIDTNSLILFPWAWSPETERVRASTEMDGFRVLPGNHLRHSFRSMGVETKYESRKEIDSQRIVYALRSNARPTRSFSSG
jgi:hypothetical protein